MSTISVSRTRGRITRRTAIRLLTAPSAALAVALVWLVADKLGGVDLHQPTFGAGAPTALSAGFAASVALLAALLGWGLLALLERFSSSPARLWLRASLLVLLVSFAGPLSGHGVGAGNRLALLGMHLAAAAVIIPLLYRSSTDRGDMRGKEAQR